MKKTLVLASLLAAFGAASAQSSVTMYGVVDAFIGQEKNAKTNNGTGGVTGVSQSKIDSGGQFGTRFGVRGSEALGNGLNAIFTLESGHNVDTGNVNGNSAPTANAAGTFFGRQAFGGFEGGFGKVTLGRQYTSYDSARGGYDVLGHSTFTATAGNGAWGSNGRDYLFRLNNSIRFDSANYSGFTFSGIYGLGEDKTTTAGASNVTSFNAQYKAGPLALVAAVQKEKAGSIGGVAVNGSGGSSAVSACVSGYLSGACNTNATSESHTLLAGSYNFGIAKLTLEYNKSSDNGTIGGAGADKELAIGVNVPFGATSVDLGYAKSKTGFTGGVGTNATSLGMHVNYALSPRTTAYVGMLNTKNNATQTGFASITTRKYSIAAVGFRHSF